MDNSNEIFTLLTSEDKKEIKESIKSLVTKQIENELNDYEEYFINFDEIQEIVNNTLQELIKEIINNHKQEIEQHILNNFYKFSK